MKDKLTMQLRILLLATVIEYAAIVFGISIVYADSFYPLGNIESSEFLFTTALIVQELPKQILFDSRSVSGLLAEQLVNLNFHNFSTNNGYGYTRSTGVGDNVSVPGGAKVSLYLVPYNRTGHTVNVNNSWVYLPEDSILETTLIPKYWDVVYFSRNLLEHRSGNALHVGARGNFQAVQEGNATQPKLMAEFTIRQDVEIENIEISCIMKSVEETEYTQLVNVKNNGSQEETVAIEHNVFNLPAQSTQVLKVMTLAPITRFLTSSLLRSTDPTKTAVPLYFPSDLVLTIFIFAQV